tara:strand:- start:1847 stop:2917 length:1071 start_codon:yes stop_codon:yes gene_type:complete
MGFKRFDPEDFVISANTVTSTVWSNNAVSLDTYFTSSVQKEGSSGPYYLNIYQTGSQDNTAAVQFAIAYANAQGGGSVQFDASVPLRAPSSTIYGQYRTLVLEDENSDFTFGPTFTGGVDNDFYVISIERARYKEKLFPGSLNLVLSSSNPNLSSLHLTDDSRYVTLPTYYGTQRAYQIISGSDGSPWSGNGYTAESGSYGLFLPDISTLLLNAKALDDTSTPGSTGLNDGCGINLGTNFTANTSGNNPTKLYEHISGSIGADGSVFKLNSQETITSDFVFVRSRNSEFNYSENPSFISGSTGEVIYDYFIDNPQTFPTTVGMYNDANELLAVAKLSKPITKDFTKEALIRVKLDF